MAREPLLHALDRGPIEERDGAQHTRLCHDAFLVDARFEDDPPLRARLARRFRIDRVDVVNFLGVEISVSIVATMSPPYAILADLVLVVHFAFVLFVVFGGLLAVKWPRVAWAHIPAAIWGTAIEFAGWICPLTPLENRLRELAGESPYRGDFIARYLIPVIYPEGLTREAQVTLGAAALAFNVAIYFIVWRRGVARR